MTEETSVQLRPTTQALTEMINVFSPIESVASEKNILASELVSMLSVITNFSL